MKRPAGIRLTQTEETKIKNQKLERRSIGIRQMAWDPIGHSGSRMRQFSTHCTELLRNFETKEVTNLAGSTRIRQATTKNHHQD